MPSIAIPELTGKLAYKGHEIAYSPALVRTSRNYYDSKASLPEGIRMSTAEEERELQRPYETVMGIIGRMKEDDRTQLLENAKDHGYVMDALGSYSLTDAEKKAVESVFATDGMLVGDPRKGNVFDGIFDTWNKDLKGAFWQMTENGLRVPKGRKLGKYETDEKGRKYYLRIVLDGNNEIGEAWIPEGPSYPDDREYVIVEWSEFGLPKVTEKIPWPHNPYVAHFLFNPVPEKFDKKSDHYDIAVSRFLTFHGRQGDCLKVDAGCTRLDSISLGEGGLNGFRPVRDSAAGITTE